MPTYLRLQRFNRDRDAMTAAQQQARFRSALAEFVADLVAGNGNTWLAIMSGRLASRTRQRDGLDLDELIRIAEHADAEQRARRVVVSERRRHHLPHVVQVPLVRRRHVDGCLEHIAEGQRRPPPGR